VTGLRPYKTEGLAHWLEDIPQHATIAVLMSASGREHVERFCGDADVDSLRRARSAREARA
jgi:hypothetical protein